MKRRNFIKNTAIWTGITLGACQPKQEIKMSNKKVVVIGAGIAGLAVARSLQQQGFVTKVIEAQDQIGGRIKTNRSLGIPFDEGASWIHGIEDNPIMQLAKEAKADTFFTNDDDIVLFDLTGKAYSDQTLLETEALFEEVLAEVEKSGKLDESFADVFNRLFPDRLNDRLWQYLLSAYLEFDTGSDIKYLSSLYFDEDENFPGIDLIITNGYDRVTQLLGDGLDIILNNRVLSINYSSKTIIITTNKDKFEADYVVVTVPLGVLKKEQISFIPALPSYKIEAIKSGYMGNVNKFLLVWDDPFWDINLQYIGYTPEVKGKFNYFLNMNKFTPYNALLTFAFGDYATTTEFMTDQEIINQITSHLQSIYGKKIPNPTYMVRTKWAKNINSFGAYSVPANKTTPQNFDLLAKSVDNKLFFAGEHTNRAYRGTVHGAYLSGMRVAEEITTLGGQ